MIDSAAHAAIDLDDLPPRAQSLDPDDLSDVFGGCAKPGQKCRSDLDCCGGAKCASSGGSSTGTAAILGVSLGPGGQGKSGTCKASKGKSKTLAIL